MAAGLSELAPVCHVCVSTPQASTHPGVCWVLTLTDQHSHLKIRSFMVYEPLWDEDGSASYTSAGVPGTVAIISKLLVSTPTALFAVPELGSG